MNLAIFFEGTGQGVQGKVTNVTLLHDACDLTDQLLHLEPGPGTHFGYYLRGSCYGRDGQKIFQSARRWFEGNWGREAKVFLFGFSRGALLARHFAAWLDKLGVEVAYMGLWDTVDATPGLEVSETCPPNVRFARHAVAEHEARRFFAYVPLREAKARGEGGRATSLDDTETVQKERVFRTSPSPLAFSSPSPLSATSPSPIVEERLFPGVHSDVGGLYADNHELADAARGWIAQGAVACGLKLKPGVAMSTRVDPKTAVRHDSQRLASNLWGLLKPRQRVFPEGMKRHGEG